jgi:hypothetical protein
LSATERVKDYDTGEMNTVRRADRGGILHSYTDDQASARADVPLFAPGGWVGNPVNYYQGGNSGIRFNYAGGISIEFVLWAQATPIWFLPFPATDQMHPVVSRSAGSGELEGGFPVK